MLLEVLYNLEDGFVYSDYTMILFDIREVNVCFGTQSKIINDYSHFICCEF
jgi:hypothetical protein